MKVPKILSLLLFAVLSPVAGLWAQETLVNDSTTLYPFVGRIAYKLSYSGKMDANVKENLPDSMVMVVGQNGFRYEFFGGMANELQSAVVWDADAQKLWLLDPLHQTADSMPSYYMGRTYKKTLGTEKSKLLGHPLKSYTLKSGNLSESLSVNDTIFFGGQRVDSLAKFQPPFISAGMQQIPLKFKRTSADGIMQSAQAVMIKPENIQISDWHIPSGYLRQEFDPAEPRHPLIQAPKQP